MRLMKRLMAIAAQGRRWLYFLGNEFATITGGFSAYAWSGLSVWTDTAPGLTKNSTYMEVSMPNTYTSGKSGVVRTVSKVDLTNVSSIRIKMSYSLGGIYNPASDRYQRLYLFVTDVTTGKWKYSSIYDALTLMLEHLGNTGLSGTDVEKTLNVSALSGSYYVCLGYAWAYQSGASTVQIKEMELIA